MSPAKSPRAANGLEGLAAVLREAHEALDEDGIPHVVFGSLATRALGGPREPRPDEDIDVFIRPPDADSALRSLERAGFVANEQDASWIHKAKRRGVTVDVIFKGAGRIYLDDEMVERARRSPVMDVEVPLIPREDLVVIKALLHDETRASDWFDAIELLRSTDVDWEYLVRRALANGTSRVLSLLLFAESEGVDVPASALDRLREAAQA